MTQPENDSNSDFAVARLNADGTIDTTFGAGTGKSVVAFDLGGTNTDTATALALKADGKIVVGGYAATAANGFDFAILQLNTDGTRDTSFNLTGRRRSHSILQRAPPRTTRRRESLSTRKAGSSLPATPKPARNHRLDRFRDRAPARDRTARSQLQRADGRAVIAFDLGGAGGGNGDGAYEPDAAT